jgi:ABC-type transport system involved in Fe-S cluster assembly fused permease/ATPase subunit
MYFGGIDFSSVSVIFSLEFGIIPTVVVFVFVFLLLGFLVGIVYYLYFHNSNYKNLLQEVD